MSRKHLKAYDAARADGDSQSSPIELSTVSIQASPDVLRELSVFLSTCADRLEASGTNDVMDHFHLRDDWTKWKPSFPDFVIAAPPAEQEPKKQQGSIAAG